MQCLAATSGHRWLGLERVPSVAVDGAGLLVEAVPYFPVAWAEQYCLRYVSLVALALVSSVLFWIFHCISAGEGLL